MFNKASASLAVESDQVRVLEKQITHLQHFCTSPFIAHFSSELVTNFHSRQMGLSI